MGKPTRFSCARCRSQPGRSTGTLLVRIGSKSQRSSYPSQMPSLILASLIAALRFPSGTEGSVRQSWWTIHVAAEAWSRGTMKALGGKGSFGRSTRTTHSCSDAATSSAIPPSGHDVVLPVSEAVLTWTSIVGRLGRSVPTARMSVRAIPSRVRAGAQLCRARVAQTQCFPTVLTIFVSTMTEASRTGSAGAESTGIACL